MCGLLSACSEKVLNILTCGLYGMQAAQESKSKPQLDLLNFEDLSIDPASSSPAPAATPSSNGSAAKAAEPTDYLSRCYFLADAPVQTDVLNPLKTRACIQVTGASTNALPAAAAAPFQYVLAGGKRSSVIYNSSWQKKPTG